MNWKEANEFLDRFYNVKNYDRLPQREKDELFDLLMKEWDVQAMKPQTPEEESKKEQMLRTISKIKQKRWG
ncbi:hypothetical protein [Priestia flexa]|uniref:hypothetical protein n=1 Tax=Priestia flexa TaxID=86664 RepID=UPI00099D92A4|nr:hypothetical protein [Priestia flexa]AQX56046.1 hypothetical protein BC359_18200 [Priestia flexa]